MNIYVIKCPNSIQRWYVQYNIQFSVYQHTSKFNSAAKEVDFGFLLNILFTKTKTNILCYAWVKQGRNQDFKTRVGGLIRDSKKREFSAIQICSYYKDIGPKWSILITCTCPKDPSEKWSLYLFINSHVEQFCVQFNN